MGEADRGREQHQRRRAAAHEDAAADHDQAATMDQHAAEFIDERGEPGKADRERAPADREAQEAGADRQEAAAELEGLPPDASMTAGGKRWSRTWRLGLILLAVALVVVSGLRMYRDVHRPGPYVHDEAQSHTIDGPFSSESFSAGGFSANARINFSALDVTKNSITAQLAIALDQSVVSELVLLDHSARSRINASNSRQWMGLIVTLHLVMCHDESDPDCMSASSVQIRLGELLVPTGKTVTATVVTRQLDLFVDANPGAFPQDEYVVSLDPVLILPDDVKSTADLGSSDPSWMPVDLSFSRGAGLVDKRVVVLYAGPGQQEFGYQVVVSREGLDQGLTYAMSLTPAFLGLLVFFLAFRVGKKQLDPGLTVILGLLTAWLTILPLRVVLVPQELGDTPSTLADDLLILDAALVLFFTVWAFTRIFPRSGH